MFNEFAGVARQNNEPDFDPLVRERLRGYVYVLRRPRDKHIFYIGKGGGFEAQGNRRVLEHFDEADEWLRRRDQQPNRKVREILSIWQNEEIVEWFIVRHGLDPAQVDEVEGALIDTFNLSQNGETTNEYRAKGANKRGVLLSSDIDALAATPVNPTKSHQRVFIFQIHKAVSSSRPAEDATRGDWIVSALNRAVAPGELAVGIVEGISRVVLQVQAWTPGSAGSKTWRFNGPVLLDHELLNKSFVDVIAPSLGYLQYGGGYVIVEFDGRGSFRTLHGSRDKETWQPC